MLEISKICSRIYNIVSIILFRPVYGFAVVEFTEEKEVEVVPVKWLSTDMKICFWPAFKTQAKLRMAVLQMVNPTDSFLPLPVKVLYQTGMHSYLCM